MIDLHVHTTASDGEYSPKEIIRLAKESDVTTIAITDHDTVEGVKEAIKEGKKIGVEVIPGVELGVTVPHGKLHILGYFIDYNNENLINTLNTLKEIRNERNERLLETFRNNGIDITIDDVLKYTNGKIIGKPHMAQVLIEKGYVSEVEEAFTNYFNKELYKNIKRKPFFVEDAFKAINDAGGIIVVAHPITLKLKGKELEDKILEYKKLGLDGIECFNNIHTQEDIKELTDIATRNNLLITAGSDYHGPNVKPNVILGRGKNGNIITDIPVVEKIKTYKKTKSSK